MYKDISYCTLSQIMQIIHCVVKNMWVNLDVVVCVTDCMYIIPCDIATQSFDCQKNLILICKVVCLSKKAAKSLERSIPDSIHRQKSDVH